MVIQIIAFTYHLTYLLGACASLRVITDTSLGIAFADDDFFQIYITISSCRANLLDTLHLNLLDKLLVVGINGIETIHHVIDVIFAVSSTIQQCKQRLEERKTLTRLIALIYTEYTLRFINNHDRMTLAEHVDRTTATKFITLIKDDSSCLICPCTLTFLFVH